ncbi:PQQ-dependent sugar dehydrogenase [Natronoglomus mannanivorans]|uniref:PQQ-dependent sugar dehydrogenase n=1 Tax=Natronoglomus mannanivorans TaxID=2979990 RepID=A0AAP2YXV7_9EURY|nr:PQQ-dependent sugar dehydrogenase [Halobacteria archaeon AArc-xg1-1]
MARLTRRQLLGASGLVGLTGSLSAIGAGASRSSASQHESDLRDAGWRPATGSPLDASVTTTQVMSDLEIPWDLEFADDDAFLTERAGRVHRIDTDALTSGDDVHSGSIDVLFDGDLPDLEVVGDGGVLGVTAHPSYPNPRSIFVYYTADDGDLHNRVVRYDLDTAQLTTLVDDIPSAEIHQGGRLEVGPDGYLWVTIGDAVDDYAADHVAITQDPGSRLGVVFRLTLDGEPAPDNPEIGPDADPRAYAYGFRNPQGLAFTPDDEAVLVEHGPVARDEVFVLCPGANYGWGIARGGPDDPDWDSYTAYDEFAPPVVHTGHEESDETWDPIDTWAPSGATFYTDDAIPEYHNRVLVAGLRGQAVFAISLYPSGVDRPSYPDGVRYDDDWLDGRYDVTVHRLFEQEYGRLRHVEQGPDGSVFVLTSNRQDWTPPGYPADDDDRIVRLDPV